MNRKTVIVSGFLAFGLVVGLFSFWMGNSNLYDTPLLINIPGEWMASAYGSRDWPGYIVGSTLFWGATGLLLSIVFKPKIIAWISGIYLLVFGGLTAYYFLGTHGLI